jgi:hypothetical protein
MPKKNSKQMLQDFKFRLGTGASLGAAGLGGVGASLRPAMSTSEGAGSLHEVVSKVAPAVTEAVAAHPYGLPLALAGAGALIGTGVAIRRQRHAALRNEQFDK